MSIPPHYRKPGATLMRSAPYRGSARRHAASGRPAVDRLLREAAALLSACPFDVPRRDVEGAMDYLASREEFMSLLDIRAESILGRPFAGVEDSPFQEIIVDAMTLLEQRIAQVIPDRPRALAR